MGTKKGPSGGAVGPCRVWYRHRGDTLGLAMSRSLGDAVVHGAGVIAEPEVTHGRVDPGGRDEFVLLASDGLWDVMDSLTAVRAAEALIQRARATARGEGRDPDQWSAAQVGDGMCLLARRRWEGLNSVMVDDITCVVLRLR